MTVFDTAAVDAFVTLTVRELLVLQLLARGYTEAQIARALSVEPQEVERCQSAIQERLHVYTVSRAVALAIQRGLIV